MITANLQPDKTLSNSVKHAPYTVYPKKYAHGFCFAVLCCGYTLTDFPISIRLASLALWQSNDCPSASKATLMNMDKYFMWIHYERLHIHNKAKHNKTVCIFLGIYCTTTTWYAHKVFASSIPLQVEFGIFQVGDTDSRRWREGRLHNDDRVIVTVPFLCTVVDVTPLDRRKARWGKRQWLHLNL